MRLLSDECLGTGRCRRARVLEGHLPASASAASSPARPVHCGAPRHRGLPRPGQRVRPHYDIARPRTNGVAAARALVPVGGCQAANPCHGVLEGVLELGVMRENARVTDSDCVFCDLTQFRAAEVCIENAHCLYASTRDPRDPDDVLPGCGVIIPIEHRLSPFDFTPEEWVAVHELPRRREGGPGRASSHLTATCSSGTASPRPAGRRITRTCT